MKHPTALPETHGSFGGGKPQVQALGNPTKMPPKVQTRDDDACNMLRWVGGSPKLMVGIGQDGLPMEITPCNLVTVMKKILTNILH
jgi:hypothetical protein